MRNLRTPGVYVQEIPSSPPSVAEVSTAIPAFLGYTEKQPSTTAEKIAVRRIESMLHYEKLFGGPKITEASIEVKWENEAVESTGKASSSPSMKDLVVTQTKNRYHLYYAIKHYFANGGGPCYIVSVGTYDIVGNEEDFRNGFKELAKEDEPTLIVLTDAATTLDRDAYYSLVNSSLKQCHDLQDRFTLVDVIDEDSKGNRDADIRVTIDGFRNGIGTKNLHYGAAYYPWLETMIPVAFDEREVKVKALNMPDNHWTTRVEGLEITSKTENSSVSFKVDPLRSGTEKVHLQFNGNHMDIVMKAPLTEAEIVAGFEEWEQKGQSKAADQGFFVKMVNDKSNASLPGAQIARLDAYTKPYFLVDVGGQNGIRFKSKIGSDKIPFVKMVATDGEEAEFEIQYDQKNNTLVINIPKEQNTALAIAHACNKAPVFQATSLLVTVLGDGSAAIPVGEEVHELKEDVPELPLELELGSKGELIIVKEVHEEPSKVIIDTTKDKAALKVSGKNLLIEGTGSTPVKDILGLKAPKGWRLAARAASELSLDGIIPEKKLSFNSVKIWMGNLDGIELVSFGEPGGLVDSLGKYGLKLDADGKKLSVSDANKLKEELKKIPIISSNPQFLLWGGGEISADSNASLTDVDGKEFAWGSLPQMKVWTTQEINKINVELVEAPKAAMTLEANDLNLTLPKTLKLSEAILELNQLSLDQKLGFYFYPAGDLELKPEYFLPFFPIQTRQKPGSVSALLLSDALRLECRGDLLSVAVQTGTDGSIAFEMKDKTLFINLADKSAKAIADAFQKWNTHPGISLTLMDKKGTVKIPALPVTPLQDQTGLPFCVELGGEKGIQVECLSPGAVTVDSTPASGEVAFNLEKDSLTIQVPAGKTAMDLVAAFAKAKQADWHIYQLEDGSAQFSNDLLGPISIDDGTGGSKRDTSLDEIKFLLTGLYNEIKSKLNKIYVTLPPSAAMAGIYADVDRTRGVWKAPANISISNIKTAKVKINDELQEMMNIDATSGKSVNAVRFFPGKGHLVWGARTLAGNNNDWRYISVRRFVIMVEESIRLATAFAVFEPNTSETWLKVSSMIDSFLYGLYQQGALAGAKAKEAYYVHVGLGTTMDAQDIREGRMIVEIGLAVVRPAEFIVLKFSQKLEEA